MTSDQLKGPFCQSCGMPLEKPEDFGTDVVGYRVNDYCRFCYADGALTDPHITLTEMIDRCADILARRGMLSPSQARTRMAQVLPRLKRWRQSPLIAR